MDKTVDLLTVFARLEELRSHGTDKKSQFDWRNYEFGQYFYENILRTEAQTDLETEFILENLNLPEGAKILDLGCGGGRNAIALAQKGFEVTGLDLNRYALEHARHQAKHHSGLNFIEKDIMEIDYQDEFHAILLVFNHFAIFEPPKAKKLMNKISEALLPEGKLLMEIPSLIHAQNLHNWQEWQLTDYWLPGKFKQLVLIENAFDEKSNIHCRDDYCLRLEDGTLFHFRQMSHLYSLAELHNLFNLFELKLMQVFADWNGKIFEEDHDENMIILAQKLL